MYNARIIKIKEKQLKNLKKDTSNTELSTQTHDKVRLIFLSLLRKAWSFEYVLQGKTQEKGNQKVLTWLRPVTLVPFNEKF